MSMKVFVVGSGPAGVSAATALLENGHEVVMLDYGNNISPERQSEVEKIADAKIEDWNDRLINPIKYAIHKKMKNKLAFGEDFPYRDSLNLLKIVLNNCGFHPSLAVGGLSNVWGGAILPYLDDDIKDWPISVKDLAPYYEKVNSLIEISTYSDEIHLDELAKDYPFYNKNRLVSTRKFSRQTQEFFYGLKKSSDYLNTNGFKLGFSRNAFHAASCTECGLCMWGCPHHLIYNSKQTLEKLSLNMNFKYINGKLVKSFMEADDGKVEISAIDKNSGEEIQFVGDKLFLACGVLPTAKIVLQSLKKYDPIEIKQSAHFLFPVIDFNIKGEYVNQKNFNTLSQLFIEINNDTISDNTVHLQVYPFNDMMTDALKYKLGWLYNPLFPIINISLIKQLLFKAFFILKKARRLKLSLP